MTHPDDRLTAAAAAARAGIEPGTWRSYVRRGLAPRPDGHIDGRTPYWASSTVDNWMNSRPGQGARTDLARPTTGDDHGQA